MPSYVIFIGGFIAFNFLFFSFIEGFLDSPDEHFNPQAQPRLLSLAEPPLRIASFNIQVFGQAKYSKPDVRDALHQILSNFDIVQVLEIRDSRGTAFEQMRQDLNAYMKMKGENVTYASVLSGRLGRTTQKEQYGFLYRTKSISVVNSYQMPDPTDVFEREPFGVRFKSTSTALQDFGMVAIHIQPDSALAEINQLHGAYETFKRQWHINDILIGGDFNSDCQYFSNDQWQNVSMRSDSRYTWLIDDMVDTTVAPSRCSYDKFIAAGRFASSIVPNSVKAYRYDEIMHMNKSEGLRISDHYPIELQLKGAPHLQTQQHIETATAFTVKDHVQVANINHIRSIYRTPGCAPSTFVVQLLKKDTHMEFLTATTMSLSASDVMPRLMTFYASCPHVLSVELLSMVEGYMKVQHLANSLPQVYGLVELHTHSYEVSVKCWLVSPNVCEVTVSYKVSGL